MIRIPFLGASFIISVFKSRRRFTMSRCNRIHFILFLTVTLTASSPIFSNVSASLTDYVPEPRDGDWIIEKEVRDIYNDVGYLIDSLDIEYGYDNEGRLSSVDGRPDYSIELEYDNDGLLANLAYQDDTFRLTHEYIYDGDNRLRKEIKNVYNFELEDTYEDGYYYGDNIVYHYIYDDDGFLIRKDVDIEDNETIDQTIHFLYNSDDHLSKEEIYNHDHKLLTEIVYSYDSNAKLINKTQFDATGSQQTATTYKYNDKGRLARKESSGLGNVTSTYSWVYSPPISPSSNHSDNDEASGDGGSMGCFISILPKWSGPNRQKATHALSGPMELIPIGASIELSYSQRRLGQLHQRLACDCLRLLYLFLHHTNGLGSEFLPL